MTRSCFASLAHIVLLPAARGLAPYQLTPAELTALNGSSLRQAVEFLRPYNAAPETWPHRQNEILVPGFMDHLLAETAANTP